METINKILADKNPESISDYFAAHRKIETEKAKRKICAEKTIKIAILYSFTVTGVKEALGVKCFYSGIVPEFYEAPYGQYEQEAFNKNSGLYEFDPELTIVFIDIVKLLGDVFFFPYRLSDKERIRMVTEKHGTIVKLIKILSKNVSGKIVFHNFEVPVYSPLGILENKQDFGFLEMVRTLNDKIAKSFKDNSEVFIFDYDSFCSKHGKKQIANYKLYYMGDIKISLDLVPSLCEEYMGFIKPMKSIIKKCIVLDMDNTLWGGTVGEDGFDGIKLGPDPEGKPFLDFQKHILSLFERGVMLAVNSRNNLEDVLKVIRKHPYMVLKEEHFTSMQVNWNDKIFNTKAIAEDINIGLDSLIFIDDDKINREMVKKVLPQVSVVELPDDVSLYSKTLMELNDFNTCQITEEDKKKGGIYSDQKKRNEYKKNVKDIKEYLKGLDIVMTVQKANSFSIPRISQLTQKTNQFNMTTRRYSEKDIRDILDSGRYLVASVSVKDKFGDNGITGVIIVEKGAGICRIDTFLLSCRILGREIEKALLAFIVQEVKREGCKRLIGEFISTKKNAPAKDFYLNNNFKLVSPGNADVQKWELDIDSSNCAEVDFIKVFCE
ncbi:MAG: HAD-IIIC family phosphatase [Candidatus Gorgyraea atricola]|nr:HAD-IIIC family phosphatase [Candidatus Gorgyraea atricola]